MKMLNATEARRDFSTVIDMAVREKPQVIKRTRDHLFLADFSFINAILEEYRFTAQVFHEKDGSITLSLHELDLAENGQSLAEAKEKLAKGILEYAEDFYDDYAYWSAAPNRKSHIPYVFKALLAGDWKVLIDKIVLES